MLVVRKKYLDTMIDLLGKPLIKVLTGQRRSGKTMLLKQLIYHVGSSFTLMVDCEEYEIANSLKDDTQLYAFIESKIHDWIKLICIDEIQMIQWRERAVLWLWKKYPDIDFFITGSNSTMLSSQLTTLLRGRYFQIMVYPFSYQEFCDYFGWSSWKESFLQFIQRGSYPSCYQFTDVVQRTEWIKQMINSTVLMDVIERYQVKEPTLLREIFLYLIWSTSDITNLSNIHKVLKAKWFSSTLQTVQNYVQYLEENYLIYSCQLHDVQGKKIFDRLKKYYASDHALRNYLFSSFDIWRWKALETLVFMELIKAWWTVYVWRIDDQEVDFVAEKNGRTIYLQVSYSLEDDTVMQREQRSFDKINNAWPKYFVSMDEWISWVSEKWYHYVNARSLKTLLE
jgi:predicted AAA+ superfamily ATPase